MNEQTKIYCAYDPLNPPIDKTTGEEIHVCGKYGTISCTNCGSRYDGDRVKKHMAENPKVH